MAVELDGWGWVFVCVDRFHRQWLVERLGYRSPGEVYTAFLARRQRAA